MCWIWSFKGEDQPSFSKDFNDTGFCFCRPPFTDYLSELGKEGFSFGDVELPEGADLGVGLIQDDDLDGPQAVVAENDNYLIDQSEATCEQVSPQQWLDRVTGTVMFCYSLVISLEGFWIFLLKICGIMFQWWKLCWSAAPGPTLLPAAFPWRHFFLFPFFRCDSIS